MNDLPPIPYPWQQTLWKRLLSLYEKQQLPHALLFTGVKGFGQLELARTFARHILDRKNLFDAGTHPDYIELRPEEGKSTIKIDQVRHLSDQFKQTSSHYRVAIIEPAEGMNNAASNALLKTLEEPTPNSLLILIAYESSRLLATTKSRCQAIRFGLENKPDTLSWLAEHLPDDISTPWLLDMADNAPLLAITLADEDNRKLRKALLRDFVQLCQHKLDPVTMATNWAKQDTDRVLRCLSQWLHDMMRIEQGIFIENADERYIDLFKKLQQQFANKDVFAIVKLINQTRSELQQFAGLNKQYQLQALFVQLIEKDVCHG
tara:strand:- start:240872 stop:241828 length:957 start_codon:yes stop_codon:yes gene_type:complete